MRRPIPPDHAVRAAGTIGNWLAGPVRWHYLAGRVPHRTRTPDVHEVPSPCVVELNDGAVAGDLGREAGDAPVPPSGRVLLGRRNERRWRRRPRADAAGARPRSGAGARRVGRRQHTKGRQRGCARCRLAPRTRSAGRARRRRQRRRSVPRRSVAAAGGAELGAARRGRFRRPAQRLHDGSGGSAWAAPAGPARGSGRRAASARRDGPAPTLPTAAREALVVRELVGALAAEAVAARDVAAVEQTTGLREERQAASAISMSALSSFTSRVPRSSTTRKRAPARRRRTAGGVLCWTATVGAAGPRRRVR